MDIDVVIAGAGPVGLMLAAELGLRGVPTLVIERLTGPDDTIKAGSINVPTVEAFDRRGLLPQLRQIHDAALASMGQFRKAEGKPAGRPAVAGHFAGLFGMDANRIDMSDQDIPLGPSAMVSIVPQKEIERILAEHVTTLGVLVRRGIAITDVSPDDDGVTVDLDTGETVRCGWLVGCDGGRSVVRKQAGFDFPGTDPTITGHQAVVTIADPEKLKPGWHRTATGMVVHGPFPGRILTVEYDGPPADRDTPVTLAELQTSLRNVSGTDVTITDVLLATRFTDNARQAGTYRIGRVLLAGDAAHVHSPFGGQGLNLGIGDAVNLGWKLAATVRGWAPDGLLDTYTTERHPIGAWVLEWTRAQVALMRPDPHTSALRTVVADLMAADDGNQYFLKKTSGVWVHYDLAGEGPAHPLAGHRVPDFPLADGTRVADHCHDGRPLLLDLADGAAAATAQAWTDRLTTLTTSVPGTPLTGLLVRPDGHVAWATEDTDPEGLRTALTRWFGSAVPAAQPGVGERI